MLLDQQGLQIAAFDAVLAAMLGSDEGEYGSKVVASASTRGHARVELRDFISCLVRAPASVLHRRLVGDAGKDPDTFIDGMESYFDEGAQGAPLIELTSDTVTPEVLGMLERAEQISREASRKVSDGILSLALLETAAGTTREFLVDWLGRSEERLKALQSRLRAELPARAEVELFGADKRLQLSLFSPSGQKLCRRLTEDAASLGVGKVTTRCLSYSMLGNESGSLTLALSFRGVDVKREIHAVLARELARPGRKRTPDFALGPETLFDAVTQVFRQAHVLARDRGGDGRISELDVACALLAKHASELTRLFPAKSPLDLSSLRDYLDSAEPEEEQQKSEERFTIADIDRLLKQRVCGQEAAVDRVLPWIKRLRFGIPRDGRPSAVLLFLGPTGSGKTQLSKELARYVYGDEDKLVFLEMGQFKTKESMNMFIGAPPGYTGYGEGKLTNGLRDAPESVVLFDEIEKADISVFDTLLRFADEGLISDPAGPVRDGRKCIIVMTTNAGQRWLRRYLEDHPEARNDSHTLSGLLFKAAMEELEGLGFRPEFLGRVDERITFLPFTEETCRKIVDGVLGRELAKFAELKGVALEVTEEVKVFLGKRAFERSGDEGARGAPRAVNEYIVTPVIDRLSQLEDDGKPLPDCVVAVMQGLSKVALVPKGEEPPAYDSPLTFDAGRLAGGRLTS